MRNAPTLMFDDKARRTSDFSDWSLASLRHDDRAGRGDLAPAADDLLRRGYRAKSPNRLPLETRDRCKAPAHMGKPTT